MTPKKEKKKKEKSKWTIITLRATKYLELCCTTKTFSYRVNQEIDAVQGKHTSLGGAFPCHNENVHQAKHKIEDSKLTSYWKKIIH